jgi:hypothetical protein
VTRATHRVTRLAKVHHAAVQDPQVKQMIEQMQTDPNFVAMAQQMQEAMGGPGGMGAMMGGGAAGGGGGGGAAARGAPAGEPPGPERMQATMQQMMSNPQMAKAMEEIGQKMMAADPNMRQMMEAMQNPDVQARAPCSHWLCDVALTVRQHRCVPTQDRRVAARASCAPWRDTGQLERAAAAGCLHALLAWQCGSCLFCACSADAKG